MTIYPNILKHTFLANIHLKMGAAILDMHVRLRSAHDVACQKLTK